MNDNLEILKSKAVLDMLTVANEFCFFSEEIKSKSKESCLNFYQKILPLLYLKGSLLPEIDVTDDSANERFVNEVQWENIYSTIKDVFKEKDTFFILNDLNEPIETSFAEQIADIYQDLKDFIMLFQRNRVSAQENAVLECKNLFATHWGKKISILMSFMHNQTYSTIEEFYF